jgi:hypothetical protein
VVCLCKLRKSIATFAERKATLPACERLHSVFSFVPSFFRGFVIRPRLIPTIPRVTMCGPIQNEVAEADNLGPPVADGRLRARRRILHPTAGGRVARGVGGWEHPLHGNRYLLPDRRSGKCPRMPHHIDNAVSLSRPKNVVERGRMAMAFSNRIGANGYVLARRRLRPSVGGRRVVSLLVPLSAVYSLSLRRILGIGDVSLDRHVWLFDVFVRGALGLV